MRGCFTLEPDLARRPTKVPQGATFTARHCTRLWSSCVSLATNSPAAQTYDTVSRASRRGATMIKDLIVNLAVGTERDRARDYALTIAEAFNAHLVGMALAYEHFISGSVRSGLAADLVAEATQQHGKAVEAAVERFDAAAKQNLVSAEHIIEKVLDRDAHVVLANAARQ